MDPTGLDLMQSTSARKKSDHFFFGGRHSSRKIKIEQKYIEHFFLYFWGLQVWNTLANVMYIMYVHTNVCIFICIHMYMYTCVLMIYIYFFSAYWATAVHGKYQYLWIFRYVYSIVINAYGYVLFGCLHVYQMHQVWCVRALRYKNQDFYSHIVSKSIFIIINLCICIYPYIHIYIYYLYLPIYVYIYIHVSMYFFYRQYIYMYIYYTHYACLA